MKVKVFHIRLLKEHLQQDQDEINTFMESVTVKKTSTELVTAQVNYWTILVFYDDQKPEPRIKSTDKIFYPADTELTEHEQKIYNTLKRWRYDRANDIGLPAYTVCNNAELVTIAKVKPQTTDDLLKIKGFAGQKIAKFGEDIIAVLNSI